MATPRPKLMIVIDGLTHEQLANLGQQIKQLSNRPIVTLVTTIPILSKEQATEKQLQAKRELATAQEALGFPAANAIVHGSNPRSAENFFLAESSDAMIKRKQNGHPAIWVKDPNASGIKEIIESSSMPVIDLSQQKSFAMQTSYKGVFAGPEAAKKPVIPEQEPPSPKPKSH